MRSDHNQLRLDEEIMLLALRDETGTPLTGYSSYMVAGAVLAELLLEGRVALVQSKLIEVRDRQPVGQPIADELLQRIASASRRESMRTWVSRFAGRRDLTKDVAVGLCRQGILRADEDTILLVFKRDVYPQVNGSHEGRIVERMRRAIFSDRENLDPRTVVLISLLKGSGLLAHIFGRREIRERKQRIEAIAKGEATGKATRELIEACDTAIMLVAILPLFTS